MIELWRTYWPMIALLYVPYLVQSVMMIVVSRGFRRIDESHPDDLPHTAGEWLVTEIARLGYADRLDVITTEETDGGRDAYHYGHETIQLSPETYFKRDPMHWAIAAHELGHARFKLRMPRVGELLLALKIIKGAVSAVAIALALGNVMFALPGVTELALKLFIVAAVMHLGVLLDEATASVLAMRSLRASTDYAFTHLRSARRVLTLAFSTYLVTFVSRVLLLTQWWRLAEISRVPAVPPTATLTTLGTIAAAVMTASLAIHCFGRFVGLFRPLRMPEHPLQRLVYQSTLVVLVLLVWNHRADPGYAYRVMLALVPISGWFIAAFMLPTIVVSIVLHRYLKRLDVDPTHRTEEFRRDHGAGLQVRKRGNASLLALLERSYDVYPTYGLRLNNLLRLTPVPLLIAYWLGG